MHNVFQRQAAVADNSRIRNGKPVPANGLNGHAPAPLLASKPILPPWKKHWLFWALLLGAVALLAALGLRLSSRDADPARISLTSALVGAKGVVEGGARDVPLAPETAGALAAIHVQVNQDVAAGTLLFE